MPCYNNTSQRALQEKCQKLSEQIFGSSLAIIFVSTFNGTEYMLVQNEQLCFNLFCMLFFLVRVFCLAITIFWLNAKQYICRDAKFGFVQMAGIECGKWKQKYEYHKFLWGVLEFMFLVITLNTTLSCSLIY